jgi:hypothetical protein
MDENLDVRHEDGLLHHYGVFEDHEPEVEPEQMKLWVLHVIANELAESNRLKRLELSRSS